MKTAISAFALFAVAAGSLGAEPGGFSIPNTKLAHDIVAEWPDLPRFDNDWDRVNVLRAWAWASTDFVHRKSCGQDTDNRFHIGYPICPPQQDYTPARFYGQFSHDKGGVWVTECALGFAELCRYFGYRAEIVSLGGVFFNEHHHAQTLVEIEHGGRKIITLHDPTFNLTFIDRTTLEPLDYFEIVRRLGRRDHTSIRATGQDYTQVPRWPRVYFPEEQVGGRQPEDIQREFWPILDSVCIPQNVNGNILYSSPRTFEKWLRCEGHDMTTGQPKFLAWLVDLGYPPDWMYLHLRMIGITSKSIKGLADRHNSAVVLGEGERLELLTN